MNFLNEITWFIPALAETVGICLFFREPLLANGKVNKVYIQLFFLFTTYLFLEVAILISKNDYLYPFFVTLSKHLGVQYTDLLNYLLVTLTIAILLKPRQLDKYSSFFWISNLLLCTILASSMATLLTSQLIVYLKVARFGPLFSTIIQVFCLGILFFLLNKIAKPIKNQIQSRIVLGCFIGISVTSMSMLIYFMREVYFVDRVSYLRLWLIVGVLTLINFFVLLLFESQRNFYETARKTELENHLFSSQIETLELQMKNTQELSRFKHDINNQTIVLAGLIESGEYDAALNLLEKRKINDTKRLFFTNHSVLNYILVEKSKEAASKDITMDARVFLPDTFQIPPEIIGIVIGNLLDNAIEAACRAKIPNNEIQLTIKFFEKNLFIDIKNSFAVEELWTRKSRKSDGFGIRNIQRVVADFKGIYETKIIEDQYITTIIFFNI